MGSASVIARKAASEAAPGDSGGITSFSSPEQVRAFFQEDTVYTPPAPAASIDDLLAFTADFASD